MKLTPFAAASISLVLAAVAQPAVAAPADPAFLSAGAPADAPEGYTAMCSREEDLCDSPAADAGPIEPAVAVAAQPPASDTILPSPSKIAGGAQSASPCLVAPVNWMEGLAHGEFGEYAAWTSPMSRRRGAYAFATSFFDQSRRHR
jgi:predicted transglutaminase-like cysteine proteinase